MQDKNQKTMSPAQIGTAYDSITNLWEREDFNRNNGMKAHEHAIRFVGEKKHALDVGCGCTGRFIDLMIREGFQPEGLDISAKMLELAKKRHPTVDFHQVDVCEWQAKQAYDFITAWDSIWHVPLQQQGPLISKLLAALAPKGVLIFSCGGTDEAGEHCDDTMGPEVYYGSLGVGGFLKLFEAEGCILRHFEYDQHPELHAYFIVQRV